MKRFLNFLKSINSIIIGVCLLSILPILLSAQNITNQSNMFIPVGLEMHTDGSLANTGFFQNNGSFFLGGDWSNAAIYQGTGLVSLEGVDQVITNNNQPIEQLAINGGGTKTLQNKITINGSITFSNGVLLVNDADTLIANTECVITGASLVSYIEGALTATGTGYKFFPVGKNGKYHPVELLDVRGISPITEVEVVENLPEIQTEFPTRVEKDFYWSRKTISGYFENSPITLGYNVSTSINLSRLVIVEGTSLAENFSLIDNVTLNTTDEIDILGSRKAVSGNIFAVGTLISDPPKKYYLSTTLSPNASNPDNRSVKIFGDNLSPLNFSFQVFNRWGLLIFESESFADMERVGWDGSKQGSVLPSGVYPYSLKYVDTTGQAIQRSGVITIVQ
jgi:hypothetical protein